MTEVITDVINVGLGTPFGSPRGPRESFCGNCIFRWDSFRASCEGSDMCFLFGMSDEDVGIATDHGSFEGSKTQGKRGRGHFWAVS